MPKLDPSKNSVEMEPFAHSRSYSEPRLGFKSFVHELAVENSSGISPQQQHIADLEKALAANYRDFQAANRTCEELRAQLSSTEKQFAALQARNAANEQSVIVLQDRLDKLLESQVTAEKYQTNSADAASPEVHLSPCLRVDRFLRLPYIITNLITTPKICCNAFGIFVWRCVGLHAYLYFLLLSALCV